MNFSIFIRHLSGLLIFSTILFLSVLIENVQKFPGIASKLPIRSVIIAKKDINLYSIGYENGQKKAIGILKAGETVDFEAWVCPYKEIKLSNGERYLILAEERENAIEIKLLKFYYF